MLFLIIKHSLRLPKLITSTDIIQTSSCGLKTLGYYFFVLMFIKIHDTFIVIQPTAIYFFEVNFLKGASCGF